MSWQQLIIQTKGPQAELISEALTVAGAAAITMQDAKDEPILEPPPETTPLWSHVYVTGLFTGEQDMAAVMTQLDTMLGERYLQHHHIETLEDSDWEKAWAEYFKPMLFGDKLWICPSWCAPPDPEGTNIFLDPGLAFGTGTHPTTALCLTHLAQHPPAGQSVLDYGCGSGILSVAAAKLGAASVTGVDIDPQALQATVANGEKNGTAITTRLPGQLPGETRVDALISNILAGPLCELAASFQNYLKPGGTLLLAGLLAEQAETVIAAYAPWIALEAVAEEEGWVLLAGTAIPR